MITHKIKGRLLAIIFVFFSGPLLAEDDSYQIELIVFSQTMPNTEVFGQAGQQAHLPSAMTELSAYKKPDITTLDDSYAALSNDPSYLPILHVSWIQPIGGDGLYAPVHIHGADGKLDGFIQMQRDKGLQIMVDLGLIANRADETGKSLVYRLDEKRPIKANEVYYLDHPKFGAIVKISPL